MSFIADTFHLPDKEVPSIDVKFYRHDDGPQTDKDQPLLGIKFYDEKGIPQPIPIEIDDPVEGIKLVRVPWRDITLASPDGYYYAENADNTQKQIIVIGPMHHTPHQFEVMWNDFRLKSVKFMDAPSKAALDPLNMIFMRRSFISIILERY